ncbi:dethiobiotin synthase [Trichothermofontia sichuanensis B231]|uniref:dethiobiotin synthase n=1 Tax=Trichothermofontia sichuanensis TaxID=3045816 RepID=UPI0022462DBA|nr:dethiobiotin synthase [Trichothermofontia sichuanensis]UZQ53738.1 dethiobiotin synthase [Trichothermofontia sichuanensis B231]
MNSGSMNSYDWPDRFFVTGTDTNVGKTVISAMLLAGTGGTYWKPIQSGLEGITDTDYVKQVTQLADEHFLPERFRLTQPLSPHLSAALDGITIALSDLQLPSQVAHRPLIVEGAGGVMVPINDRHYIIDLIATWGLPVCLVARSTLGTINHTLLSIAQLRRFEIPILGIIVNGPENIENCRAIAHYGNVKMIGQVPPLATINPATLRQAFSQLNWH